MWWEILKSSREEAYSKFLEEFGPKVDLKFLEVENFLDDPYYNTHNLEYYLSVSNVSGKITSHWSIQSNGANIRFVSDKYPQYQVFVEGMFKEEYPERYEEIVDMLDGANSNKGDPSPTIGRYYDVLIDIMRFLRERMNHLTIEEEIKSLLLQATSVFFINPESKVSLKDVDKKSFIIHFITEDMVDRMIADVVALRVRNKETTGLRQNLYNLYYKLFLEATRESTHENLGMIVSSTVGYLADEVIGYLYRQVKAYMEEEP